jgi:hypothetical protein
MNSSVFIGPSRRFAHDSKPAVGTDGASTVQLTEVPPGCNAQRREEGRTASPSIDRTIVAQQDAYSPGKPAASPPFREADAAHTAGEMVERTNRTPPSIVAQTTPPGWRLAAENTPA